MFIKLLQNVTDFYLAVQINLWVVYTISKSMLFQSWFTFIIISNVYRYNQQKLFDTHDKHYAKHRLLLLEVYNTFIFSQHTLFNFGVNLIFYNTQSGLFLTMLYLTVTYSSIIDLDILIHS